MATTGLKNGRTWKVNSVRNLRKWNEEGEKIICLVVPQGETASLSRTILFGKSFISFLKFCTLKVCSVNKHIEHLLHSRHYSKLVEI